MSGLKASSYNKSRSPIYDANTQTEYCLLHGSRQLSVGRDSIRIELPNTLVVFENCLVVCEDPLPHTHWNWVWKPERGYIIAVWKKYTVGQEEKMGKGKNMNEEKEGRKNQCTNNGLFLFQNRSKEPEERNF